VGPGGRWFYTLPSIGILFLLFTSCVTGFENGRQGLGSQVKPVALYVPAAQDQSGYGGQSSRLSFAVRDKLAHQSSIRLTKPSQAQWGLSLKILNRQQAVVAVDDCNNPGTPTVGSGAYLCSEIHPELVDGNNPTDQPTSFQQPSISPATESLSLVVEVRLIDLNDGKVIFAKKYFSENVPAVVFNEIGDTGDGRTMSYTQDDPHVHVLRYQEAVNNAVSLYSQAIAADVQRLVNQSARSL
jgi:hypothetical protein